MVKKWIDWLRRGPSDGHAESHGGRRGRRWRRRVLTILAVAAMAFASCTAAVFVWPPQGAPARVDAIVLLAGPGDRMTVALGLARQHRAPVLVVSRGWMGYGGPCPPPLAGVKTICFNPDPGDTRGEAEYIGALAKRYGWRSVLLVATPPQGIRAELIVGRCFNGAVFLQSAPLSLRNWPYQIAYGWGALFKALVLVRGC